MEKSAPDHTSSLEKSSSASASPRLCPICRSPVEQSLHDPGLRRTYFACGACGFIFLASEDRLPLQLQKARYLRHENSLSEKGYRSFLDSFLRKTVIPYVEKGTRVLDFGSGPVPAFSWLLKQNGYRVDSFDPVFCPDYSWRKRRYGAVILVEVLEHLTDPVDTLSRLRDRLSPGGFLCIRSSLHEGDLSRFESWWYRQDPTHVSFFSAASLQHLAAKLGFVVISISENRDAILQLGDPDS